MSIFSHLRKSRQQAKEHNAKLAEQKKKDSQRTPYRHVPTHAASDAISSAPPAWREVNDRPRIVEQNRRRSAMAAAGYSMNMPSTTTIPAMPRVTSSLSYVSYPSGEASPHVGMPRAYSSSSVHHPYGANREVVYSMPDATLSQPSSWKGKEVTRNSFSGYDISGGSSSLVSKGEVGSALMFSRASNSSHDELEMALVSPTRPKIKAVQNLQVPQPHPIQQLQTYHQVQHAQQTKQLQAAQQAQIQSVTPPPQPVQPAAAVPQPQSPVPESPRPASGHAHRLHPSHRRTSSETSDRTAVPVSTKPAPRDSRPPPTSMRGFNFIATTVNNHQPALGSKPAQPELNNGARQNAPQYRASIDYSGFAPRAPAAPVVAPPASRNSSDVNLGAFSTPSPSLSLSGGQVTPPSGGQRPYQSRMKEHSPSPATRQQQPEMEPIVSNGYARHARSEMPPPLAHENLVNIFPEPVPESYNAKSGRGKLNKGKKTRWSFAKSSPITA
ncbi:hypothetical protein ISF_05805 [Cordyceps fumosorosea ARSEF 2679]|uniref:Uncharacterized protein n=1 Tax=Cordyceps fumosorosea (strain ARSEF 2679) TaxID=1081104 RepID=A0A167TMZ9_CORFA|nr:hypothetical protein ISF_05805 [Cordyceps fumosorosea ARSEF 2679]OAA60766.1 hypothetical protein ISF_05805 [Cordyceps fumosorosea ARSEF 2679]